MPYLRDRVIVLKKEPFREQDRRYVMYGREHGLLSAVARGASLPRSKQAGHLEPFSEAEVMIAPGKAFDKLAVARMVLHPPFASAPGGLAGLAVCGAFADLLVRLLRPGIADERIFGLLAELIAVSSTLPAEPSPERGRLLYAAATLRLLDILGYGPETPSGSDTVGSTYIASVYSMMRAGSLANLLRVTAPREIFTAAAGLVDAALHATSLTVEPHGPRTIYALTRATYSRLETA